MTITPRSELISSYSTRTAYDDDIALQRAENEGMPVLALQRMASPNLFGRVSIYLRNGIASFTKEQELTLEQLLADLKTMSRSDSRLRKLSSASLMSLMASDIRDAKQFSIESGLRARPMRAWRQRYNGLDRFVR